jgi:hypothetical protein
VWGDVRRMMTASAEGFDDDISTPDDISERLVTGEAKITDGGSRRIIQETNDVELRPSPRLHFIHFSRNCTTSSPL